MTSVKLSPTGAFVLLGLTRGSHEGHAHHPDRRHPVVTVCRLGDMRRMAQVTCASEGQQHDANVALFHPLPGVGVVYGTRQGQVACVLSKKELKSAGTLPSDAP